MTILCVEKNFLPISLLEWVQLFSYIVSAIGIVLAALSYKSSIKIRKAELIKSLFEKFYESTNYKEIRQFIDSRIWSEEGHFISTPSDKDEEKFSDYLNFFEFLGSLYRTKQLTLEEIKSMFTYYLGLLNKSTYCKEYIKEHKFKNLEILLEDFSKNEIKK